MCCSYTIVVSLWRGIWQYPNAFKYLLAFTIYNDSIFAFAAVTGEASCFSARSLWPAQMMLLTGNLFNLSFRPSLVEYTCYSIAGTAASILGATAFYVLFPRLRYTLRQWTIGCYVLVSFVAFWCLLGLSGRSAVGFKHRAEFYIAQVVQNLATAILTVVFRVLFPELFPTGSEIQYFGFQLVVSAIHA